MNSERSIRRLYFTPNMFVALCNIGVNSFLIHTLHKLGKINNISFKLVTLLSVLDVCVGFSLGTHEIALLCISTEEGFLILRVYAAATLYTVCELEGFTILLIAIDRFFHMKYPSRYSLIVTKRRAIVAVAVVFLLSIAHAAMEVYAALIHAENLFVDQLVVSGSIFAVLVALTVTYIVTYMEVRRRAMRRPVQNNGRPVVRPIRNSAAELSRTVFVILTALWMICLPLSVLAPMKEHYLFVKNRVVSHVFYASESLLFFNSTINAIIFIGFNTDVKRYTRRLFTFRCCERADPVQPSNGVFVLSIRSI